MRRRFIHPLLKRIALVALIGYVALFALLVVGDSYFVYQARPGPSEPVEAGLEGFARHTLDVAGLPIISYWENASGGDGPTLLYFHGNGGGLHLHTPMLAAIAKHGLHIVAVEYPGYPGGDGRPSEALLVAQAVALYDHIAAREDRTPAIWGFSLGSGVATQLAAQRTPASLVLEAPFTAVVDRAAELFPIIPVHRTMRNTYRSREYIGKITAPIFIMHGDTDYIIPIRHGRALFAMANEPKSFHEYPGFGHLDLMDSAAYADAVAFVRASAQPR